MDERVTAVVLLDAASPSVTIRALFASDFCYVGGVLGLKKYLNKIKFKDLQFPKIAKKKQFPSIQDCENFKI